MKKIIIAVIVIVAAFVQTSSAQNGNSSPFNPIITAYLNLKNALVMDRGDSARLAASRLYSEIGKLPMEKLPADQHKAWMQYNEKLSYDAEHIKGTGDIDHQREHFVSLSANMYKLVKAANINSMDLYYDYCPMANDNKGAYWISEQSKIQNPYMGKRMSLCGSVKDSLKAAQ